VGTGSHRRREHVLTGGLGGVVRRGVVVLAALGRQFEPSLWRGEALAQGQRLLTGRRVGVVGGRDHESVPPRRFSSRCGQPPLWLRLGTGDAAVWGEVNVRGVYASPWPIPDGVRVLDLGGHAGYFARWALSSWPLSEILSVEPDEANAELLALNAAALADGRWRYVRAAAATAAGSASFAGGRGSGSKLGSGGEDTVETIDALPLLGGCDFAKIDIEGGEWALLDDARFRDCCPPMLVVEYHASDEITDAATEARRRLEDCGYVVSDGHGEELPGVGVLWARKNVAGAHDERT
jgi:FkbM family methyltransferase